MIATVKFKIDNKVYNTTIKFADCDEIIINNDQLKLNIAGKLINMAYKSNNIDDIVYHNVIKNTIANNIEIMSITIPNYAKEK